MKSKLFLGFLIIFLTITNKDLYSQNAVSTLDKLIGKEWFTIFPGEKKFSNFDIYTKEIRTTTFRFNNVDSKLFYQFYLSDKAETIFNNSDVGKIEEGKYIITLSEKGKLGVFEIITLTSTSLELKNLGNKSILNFSAK